MPPSKSRKTPPIAKVVAAPAVRLFSPLPVLAGGALAYLLLAAAVDVWVMRAPAGNSVFQITLLVLLGLACVVAGEAALALIRAIPTHEMLGWPFRAAAAASVAYALSYGRRVFDNTWNYDDWGYIVPQPLDITKSLNDHFVPLLNIVLWGMRRVFGFDYIGAACLQEAAFLLIVLVLAHLLWSATRRPWILMLLVGLFAMWPSYGVARSWFGGGFWLTASAALLCVYVLHARSLVSGETLRKTDLAVSAALAAATVFISSQTLVPGVYLAAFCAAAVLFSQRRSADLRRFGIIFAISLLPTALAFWGRSVYVVREPLNPSGLLDGSLFNNIVIFILNKLFFVSSFLWQPPRLALYLYSVWAVALVACARKLASKNLDPDRAAGLGSLILGGCAVFVVPLVQIGLGRRWGYDAVINTYYVTLPFLGLWMASAGIGLTLLARPKDDRAPRFSWGVVFAVAAVFAATDLSQWLQHDEPPIEKRVQLIHMQRQFLDSLGAAACDLAALHRNGPAIHWVPRYDISECRVCQDTIGPPQFLRDLKLDSLVRIAAHRSCPAVDLDRIAPEGPAVDSAAVTDGTESPAAVSFVRQYLAPLDHPVTTP